MYSEDPISDRVGGFVNGPAGGKGWESRADTVLARVLPHTKE